MLFRRIALLLAAAVLATALVAATPAAAADPVEELRTRLEKIPGLRIEFLTVEDDVVFGWLYYRQPVDHKRPNGETFEQVINLWHRGYDRPTALHTSGYGVGGALTEPAQLIDGNQLSVEHRFFNESTPAGKDWSKLTVWQAATDHHRIVSAFKQALYGGRWLSTGGSKDGMAAVYHRRFYPSDVDATVAYVAANDVENARDNYTEFIQRAGDDPACNAALRTLQRTALSRRSALVAKLTAYAKANELSYESTFGTVDRAFEAAVLDTPFTMWQGGGQADCRRVPPATATDQKVFDFIESIVSWGFYSDEGTAGFLPYYFQAAKQLNWPNTSSNTWWLRGLLRYEEAASAPTMVPDEIEPRHEPAAMRDIDSWVKQSGKRLMFVYGENDPWSAEPFEPGQGTRDSHWYTVPDGNHGAKIGQLPAAQRVQATHILQSWMGVQRTRLAVAHTGEPLGPRLPAG